MALLTWVRAQYDRVGAVASIVAGGIALLLGWLGVSSTSYPAEQIPYVISGGVLGVFLLGVGGILFLSADMRDEWRKLDRLERALARATIPSPGGDAARPEDHAVEVGAATVEVDTTHGNGGRRPRRAPAKKAGR